MGERVDPGAGGGGPASIPPASGIDPLARLHVPRIQTGLLRSRIRQVCAINGPEQVQQSACRKPVRNYSITSSARASSEGGMVRPSALAVLRLTINSNFDGCSTGSSAGLAPFRILSTYVAARRQLSRTFGP